MTLAELLAGAMPDEESLRSLAIVFDSELAQRMVNIHAWHGDPRFTAYPAATSDGRWFHRADILPDCIKPGGLYAAGFAFLDASRFADIEVLPLSEVTLADPQPPQLQPDEPPAP